jgi:hypothetical protein
MKFLKNWQIDTAKVPAYTAFKKPFTIDIDYELLNIMSKMENEYITKDRLKLLYPLINAIDKKTNTLKLSYYHPFNLGRFYPTNSLSPINVSRHIKHTLFYYMDWFDLDMVRGHPSIIFSIAENNNLHLKTFEKYLTNKDEVIAELLEHYQNEQGTLTGKDIKDIFNISIYGGGHSTWEKQMAENKKEVGTSEIHYIEKEFVKECRLVMDIVYSNNQMILEMVRGTEETEYKLKCKVMAYFCGTIENEILHLAYKFMCERGVIKNNEVLLEYDGLCFPNPRLTDFDEILNELNYKIREKTKINVKMINKKYDIEYVHNDIMELRDKPREIYEDTDNETKSVPTEISTEEEFDYDFDSVSDRFETNHCKIINKGIFIKQLKNDNIVMSKQHMKMSYENMTYEKIIKGKIINSNFINDWLVNNPKQRSYEDIDVYPNVSKCPSNVFNMWRKFEMELVTDYKPNIEARDFILKHLKIICGNEESVYQYFLKWIAQMIQFPETKSNCPTFISKEGGGKGTVMRLFEKMLGSSKVYETTNPSRDVWGDFNGRMANTYLINLNELSKKETIESEGKIKGLITDPKLTINNKGSNQYDINSFHRFIISTNNEEPMNTTKDDRRKWIVRCSDELIGDKEYFKTFYKYLDDVNVIKTCYEYFKSIPDMEDFNKLELPSTQYQKQLKEYSISPIESWLKQFTYHNQTREYIELKAESILEKFNEWKITNEVEYTCNSMKFMIRMSRLKIPGIGKHHGNSYNTTVFNIPLMKTYFQIGCLLEIPKK